MTNQNALDKIHALPRFNRGNTLAPVLSLLHTLHDPQRMMRAIHVAGTNGKGSVSTMISAALSAAGHRVGLYTSPYINHFRERFRINDKPVSPAVFTRATHRVFEVLRRASYAKNLSQFDVITAIAFLIFAEEGCDVVVLECGLGGRLDATNAIPAPMAAVICNIGFDHTDILGNNITAITTEKCGIIKPDTGAVICGPQDYPEATRTVESISVQQGTPCVTVKNDYRIEECRLGALRFTYRGKTYTSSLAAKYQVKNAATAIETLLVLQAAGMRIPDEAIEAGLARAFIPARMELASLVPNILLDGAHNPDGMRALRESVEALSPRFERLFCVVGMLEDKDPEKALDEFFSSPILSQKMAGILTVAPDSPRACPPERLAALIQKKSKAPVVPCPEITDVFDRIIFQMHPDDLMLCFGSLYMMGELREAIRTRYSK